MKSVAVVRIKGQVNLNRKLKDTLDMLRLYRKNYCTVVELTPEKMGMIKKVKDCVAWGEISEEVKAKLPKGFFKLSYVKKPKKGKLENIGDMLVK